MLTQDEAEVYDRQIRLWGVNAQGKIRRSKVLMLGFNGVASEVAKILVLAGIDSLTIIDDQTLQDDDLTSNLFCRRSSENSEYRTHAVESKLKILNPLVKVNVENSPITLKNREDIKDYDLVTLHSFLTIEETSIINDICREHGVKLYIVLDYGFFGFMFNDLGPEFKFTYEEFCDHANEVQAIEEDGEEDRPKKRRRVESAPKQREPNQKTTKFDCLSYTTFRDMIALKTNFNKQTSPVMIISIAMYRFYSQFHHLPHHEDDLSTLNKIIVSLKDSLNLDDSVFKHLDKNWRDNIHGSLSPVCAVMGGVAGQDIIRALSNRDIPLMNTFAFDGLSMNGIVEKVGIETKTQKAAMVRDILQIDDDEDCQTI